MGKPKVSWLVHWQYVPDKWKHESRWTAAEFPTFLEAIGFVGSLEKPDRLVIVTISRQVEKLDETLDPRTVFKEDAESE